MTEAAASIKTYLSLAFIFFISAVAASSIGVSPAQASVTDGTIIAGGNVGFAWANNAGWMNFGLSSGNIHVTDAALTGYAWNDNYGWINLAPTNGGVTNNNQGTLGGYAWGAGLGWINFSGVTINASGKFTGSASGTMIGTLTFDCANCDVRTDWRPAGARSSSNPVQASDSTPPQAPTSFTVAVAPDGESVLLTWTDPPESDLAQLIILRSVGDFPISGDAYAVVAKGDQRYVDAGVTSGTTYNYVVKAMDAAGNFSLTTTKSVTFVSTLVPPKTYILYRVGNAYAVFDPALSPSAPLATPVTFTIAYDKTLLTALLKTGQTLALARLDPTTPATPPPSSMLSRLNLRRLIRTYHPALSLVPCASTHICSADGKFAIERLLPGVGTTPIPTTMTPTTLATLAPYSWTIVSGATANTAQGSFTFAGSVQGRYAIVITMKE